MTVLLLLQKRSTSERKLPRTIIPTLLLYMRTGRAAGPVMQGWGACGPEGIAGTLNPVSMANGQR